MAQIIKRLLWWSDNKVEKGQSQIRKPLSTEFENTILSMLEEAIEDANLVGNRHDINFNPILARKDYLASIIEVSECSQRKLVARLNFASSEYCFMSFYFQ
eukprot:TRINITY_DN9240_c0_g1_i2.p1 TRINITY_DN9240_c0_g1~~TRINITY_DN9240_c0_g1_i2.p1  ORF type:complete len:101 (-),score=2.84 TRINITY_DN9240_c0_g1_i2:163-465(-)